MQTIHNSDNTSIARALSLSLDYAKLTVESRLALPIMTPKAPAGHFTVLYFAYASSYTHKTSEYLPAPLEGAKLFGVLEQRYAGFTEKVLSSCLVTVNLEYVDVGSESSLGSSKAVPQQPLLIKEGDEVAIIPPVSSG